MSGLKKHSVKNIYTPTPVIIEEHYQQPLVPCVPPSSVSSSTYSEIMTNLNLMYIVFFFTLLYSLTISQTYYLVLNVHVLYISTNL